MRIKLALVALLIVLGGGVASADLSPHSYNFTVANTGMGVEDARLRFHIDTLAVPGEQYFIDNVALVCPLPPKPLAMIVNGDFTGTLAPWKFFSNAPAPTPTAAEIGDEAVISFGKDGSNTQLFQRDIHLPAAGTLCTLTFDACSTEGNNFGVKLIKHTAPYTSYGLRLDGTGSSPEVDVAPCSAPTACGNSVLDPGEDCDGGGNTPMCDADCTFAVCGDGFLNPLSGEQCDFGVFKGTIGGGMGVGGCDAFCQIEDEQCDDAVCILFAELGATPVPMYCGTCSDGIQNLNETGVDCGGVCPDCAVCGDNMLQLGEGCDDGNTTPGDGCDATCQIEDPCKANATFCKAASR